MARSDALPLWIVICGLGLTQIIGWGTTYYMLGALSQDIAQSTGWSGTLIFGAFSAALLLSGLISRSGGRLTDRIGGRRVMIAGSLCAVAGLTVMGLFPHPVTYVAGWLLLGLAMRFATYDAAFASLTQIAGQGARRAISYLTLFGGLASTVFWPVSHYLALNIGWSHTLLAYAALNLLVCLPIHWAVLHGAKGDRVTERVADTAQSVHVTGRGRLVAITLFASAVALNGLVFSSISAHVVPLFQGLGFAGDEAVFMAALIGPSQVASRLGEILMGRRLTPMHLGLIAFGLLPVAVALFALMGFSWPAAIVFAVLYGASNGLVTIAKGAVPLMLFGAKGYGEVLGVISAPNLIVNAVAPLLFALLLGVVSAQASLLIAGGAALASTLFMLWLARLHPQQT
ncbi:MAG: MFS transporter [Aestuariivirga sp.]|uniref:MFS transporter n=1 Tax=Aestuariivirga sp. TaxID=2650926 RepID=UPI0025BE82FC|nr:MFS transporter [Aestuariivirga sp.]MCA3560393.1 MFS transporter [Aestuariivirga sp.]